jgi:hypothetical protein
MHDSKLAIALWVSLVAVLGAGDARADEEAARQAKGDLEGFATSVWDATKNGMFGNNNFFRPPSECASAVQRGTDAGLQPTDTYRDGAGNSVLWKRATDVCTQYARLHPLRGVIDEIQPRLQTIAAYVGPDGKPITSVTGDAYRDTVKDAQACIASIDKAIKAGVPTDVAFAPNDNHNDTRITLAQAHTKCTDYVGFGGKAAAADDKRQADELAALRAKWSKLGVTGDRLKYLIENGHHIILGKGCVELSPKGLKTSPVFYEVYSDDASWIVYKTQFKKDKKTKSSSKRFRRDGGYSCK